MRLRKRLPGFGFLRVRGTAEEAPRLFSNKMQLRCLFAAIYETARRPELHLS